MNIIWDQYKLGLQTYLEEVETDLMLFSLYFSAAHFITVFVKLYWNNILHAAF